MGDARERDDDDAGPETWWPSDSVEGFGSLHLGSQQETSIANTASNILWTTGSLSDPIPNGFYSLIPVTFFLVGIASFQYRFSS